VWEGAYSILELAQFFGRAGRRKKEKAWATLFWVSSPLFEQPHLPGGVQLCKNLGMQKEVKEEEEEEAIKKRMTIKIKQTDSRWDILPDMHNPAANRVSFLFRDKQTNNRNFSFLFGARRCLFLSLKRICG